jgi:peptide/nickel transport system permease protein
VTANPPSSLASDTGSAEGRPEPGATSSVRSPWMRAAQRFARQPAGVVGLALILLYISMALAAPVISPHDPNQAYSASALHPPSGQFLLGTDELGRDIFARIIYGARPALAVGAAAVAVGACAGALSGFAAGFYKGRAASIVMRMWDGVFAIPAVLVGLLLAATFGASNLSIGIAVGIAAAPSLARVAYSATLAEMERGYVEACRALGMRPRRVFFAHVIPNALSPVIVNLALTMGGAVLIEAALAYLGVGPPPPASAWGVMLSTSRNYLGQAWWYGLFPGLAITGLVLALNLLADAARDALDPRSE